MCDAERLSVMFNNHVVWPDASMQRLNKVDSGKKSEAREGFCGIGNGHKAVARNCFSVSKSLVVAYAMIQSSLFSICLSAQSKALVETLSPIIANSMM